MNIKDQFHVLNDSNIFQILDHAPFEPFIVSRLIIVVRSQKSLRNVIY